MAAFRPAIGTKKNFYTTVKPKGKSLVKIKEIWLDTETGYTYFLIDENPLDNTVDFINNLSYNNNIEENIFLNDDYIQAL